MKKRMTAILLSLLLALCLPSCLPKTQDLPFEAVYELVSAVSDGVDVTDEFETFVVDCKADGTMRLTVSRLGALVRRDSTYTFDGTTLTETFSGGSQVYTLDGDTLSTEYVDFGETVIAALKKKIAAAETGAVDFEGILFGPDMADSKIFNYCPAVLTETDEAGNEVMHVWYCTNRDDGVIMDHIGYRKGVKQSDGKWVFSDQQIVLEPTPGTWDERHTCDPAVIRGAFSYHGKQYGYLMAYLGCVTDDYSNNETGIAVAERPEGPWIKVDELNPIVPWADECADGAWGTGMPALVSIDGAGEVLLFYQSSTRGTGIQRWDFSDLDALNVKPKFNVSLTHRGIVNSQGVVCRVNIPDFGYDPVKKRFYVCGVTNEKNPPDVTVTRVNSHSLVAYLENVDSVEALSDLLESGAYTWKMLGYVGPNVTGFERNHNPGLVRDALGRIPDSDRIGVVVSTGRNSWGNENIFTYRLHGAYLNS